MAAAATAQQRVLGMRGLVATLLLMLLQYAAAQPKGWAMTDRFSGFRYEVFGHVQGVNFEQEVQNKAESIGCFGWVQSSTRGTAVGECRCAKKTGPLMKKWLKTGPGNVQIDKTDIKDYADTKIRFHFSHFRILDADRETCFEDPPHSCNDELYGTAKDEL